MVEFPDPEFLPIPEPNEAEQDRIRTIEEKRSRAGAAQAKPIKPTKQPADMTLDEMQALRATLQDRLSAIEDKRMRVLAAMINIDQQVANRFGQPFDVGFPIPAWPDDLED